MKRTKVITTFEGGQADAQFARRSHEEIAAATSKTLRNIRITTGGMAERRPGLAFISTRPGTSRMVPFLYSDGTRVILLFSNARVDILDNTGTVLQTLTGRPWGGSDAPTMQFALGFNEIYIASRSFPPYKLTAASASSWSGASMSFDVGGNGASKAPFYRYAARGITLQPSSTTGAVTVTASSSVFTASHVGTRVRIAGRDIAISGYTSGTQVTGTWAVTGYPTYRCTVASTAMLAAGDAVQFSTTLYEGEVYQIASATEVDILMTSSLAGPTTGTDYIIGPSGKTAVVSAASVTGYAATAQWDEQMISAARGYPGGCCLHRGRLYFYDFPNAPAFIAASSAGLYSDFDVGTALDSDAIIDDLGDAPGARIRHLVSREQLIALTSNGSYNVGEGRGTPITPTTIAFYFIGPEPAGACAPVSPAEGVLYAETNADRLIALAPTGNVQASWATGELGMIAPDIMASPTRLCFVDGSAWGPERYLLCVNSDGTLGVMHYRRDGNVVGWSPWDTDGTFVDVCAFDSTVWAIVLRGSNYTLESFSTDRLLDRSDLTTTAAGAYPTNANWGGETVTLIWRKTVDGEARRGYMGVYDASVIGVIADGPVADASRDYEGGRDFTVTLEPWEPYDPISHTLKATRISQFAVDLLESGCALVDGGNTLSPFRMADDVTEPPPLRTGTRKKKLLGRRNDLTKPISQTEAAPLKVRSITMVVS